MIYLGLAAAAAVAERSHYELLAQGVSGVIPLWRDSAGGCYFAKADLAAVPRRTTCIVKGCERRLKVVGLCLCSTHYRRYRSGRDVLARIQVEKARRGPARVNQTRHVLQVAPRPEQAEVLEWILGDGQATRTGGVTTPWELARQDRHADQLGTPEMWQEVADAALERAWADLLDGSYAKRLQGRLAACRPSRPPTIQNPILAVLP